MYIKNLKSFLEAKSGNLYDWGCVMLYLNISNWDEIGSSIDSEDLYKPESQAHGLETNPHITILYGLHSDIPDEKVLEICDGLKESDFDIEVRGIDCFENKDYDVVKMNVVSEELVKLNREFSKLPHTTDYPDYKPHLTIAYVKPGTGKKYEQPEFRYIFKKFEKIVYSKTNGEKIEIRLK